MIKTLYIKLFFLLFVMVFVACEKKTVNPKQGDGSGIDKSNVYRDDAEENQLKEDVWYYFKVLSLWQDNIPPIKYSELNKIQEDNYIRDNYTQYFETAEDVLDFLVSKTPTDASTGEAIDRFSFLDMEGVVSGEIQDAVATSYGMYVFFLQTDEAYEDGNNAYLYVRMVDVGSPAYVAGIRRGDRIMRMNSRTDLDYNSQKVQNFNGISQELSSSTMEIVWRSTSGQDFTKTINSTTYSFDPILDKKVFSVGTKKVGYLAFSSFVSIVSDWGTPTAIRTKFDQIFNDFQSADVASLIVDLRYNGGGSVATAEYFVNRIAPSNADGEQMYYYKVNRLLTQDWKWTRPDSAFAPVKIAKIGGLELDRVYFLVTDGTASASELLINSLKPHMNVQVIGPEKTYGKPVGFFPIEIGANDEAEIYVTSFQMFNSQGYGDYFGGLDLNKQAADGYLKAFGDPEENLLKHALYHVENGSYSTSALGKSASLSGGGRADRAKTGSIGPRRAGDYGMFKFPQRMKR